MGRFLIKIKDRYFEWSTIVDAPMTCALTLNELKEYIKDEYGNKGMRELSSRLERVEKYGTSLQSRTSVVDAIFLNRAGPDETQLSADEIYDGYQLPTTPEELQVE